MCTTLNIAADEIEKLQGRAEKAEAELAQERARWCSWNQDDDGYWHTACGNAFEFMNDGPNENGTVFCQYCGGKVDAAIAAEGAKE